MKDKKLEIVLSVLIDISLKSKKFRLLEQEQEKIEEILQLFISEEQITFLGNTSASNQPYLYLIPEYYSLTNELIDKINAKFDLYTTDNNEYYKVWLNDSGILVKISINRDSFNKTEKSIYIPNELVV
ncbi:hypothetical protein [Staphylococcus epidermidis]|uniref:hypothetical protein n=1 Tax=Staphylococcus epidermidis TaxID=1282 RepID=UPI0001F491FD|nr:hypothetical protein [Staphylococcus epidermidis]EFV88253.1 hypothetical protein GSEF_1920 [Staphylococcus epidermidis FRI909]EHR97824.1 hypothetical protein SEVCU128_0314 [Staphylococcus epidermidis VCU128]KEI46608.1 hypothetical protein L086_0109780 [Staphylococcus epidermidis UC7032]MCD8854575.1 hypothetical protein [Staphylococcus epidermidis]MCG2501742.1 hypothetical protein [Staphylococcus epidermidis]